MCIIVDANAAHELENKTDDGRPVLRWLLSGSGGLIIGGKLSKELNATRFFSTLLELRRAGKVFIVGEEKILACEKKITNLNICVSNDSHLLALADASECRLIFSKDKKLHKDAKNPRLLNPAAQIYKDKSHSHLLRDCKCR